VDHDEALGGELRYEVAEVAVIVVAEVAVVVAAMVVVVPVVSAH
jgi:hypothetical protein